MIFIGNKNLWSKFIFAASVASAGFVYSEFADAAVNSNTQMAATKMGAAAVTEISFSKGSIELSDNAKSELQQFMTEAAKKGTIKEVRVAAWADQEYPQKDVSIAADQINLAEKRAEGIETYLKNSINIPNTRVSTINMAERPNKLQKILKTPGAQTKNTLESAGAAPTNKDQTGFFGLKGKASEAVVLVFYN